MTPFHQVRSWLRLASPADRTGTVVAVVVVIALCGWLVTPVHRGSGLATGQSVTSRGVAAGADAGSSVSNQPGTATGVASGESPAGASGSSAGASAGVITSNGGVSVGSSGPGGATSGGAGQGGGTAPGSTRQCPPGTDQGLTATDINVAVTLVNLVGAAGNDAVGVPSTTEQQQDWQEVADSVNAAGGTACRKLVLHFYPVNPLDSSNTQQQCLQIASDRPFAALDLGALTDVGAGDCIPAQKIPLISQFVNKDQLNKYFPYYINPLSLQEINYHSGYLGASQKGYFSAASGFHKLGIIYQSCRPAVVAAGRAELRNAGIPDAATVAYNLGCPPGRQNSPADLQQAVLAFKGAGVTHVTELDANGWASFTKTAGQQNYKPKYVFAEDAASNDTFGAFAPDPNNFDGAVDIVGRRLGEQKTPGYVPSAGTVKCNAIYAAHGQKPVYQQGAGFGGVVCNFLWFIATMFDHAPRLERSSLVAGMHSLGVLDSSFPWGPVDFSAVPPNSPYGRENWRVDQFSKSCGCWQVLDPVFHPPFS